MDQYFDNIQISDKGMVKLIRNNGKDYIFPASKIITVHRVKPNDDPNSWIPIARDLCNILNVDAFQETRPIPYVSKQMKDTSTLIFHILNSYITVWIMLMPIQLT